MDALVVLLAYLLGSVSVGTLVGRYHGEDVRTRDLPGTSGMFRQYGPAWGVAVLLLDIGKGAIAAWLAAALGTPWVLPLAALAVVAGHIYPVFFGFRGGGGLATSAGFLLFFYPLLTLLTLALGLGVAGLYYLGYWQRHKRSVYPIPFAAPFAYLFLLLSLWADPVGLAALLAMTTIILLRGLQLFRRPRPG